MKKNKTFIFIIPFIFISFLCFVNNVEAKKVCDLGGDLRNDGRCYKKIPEAITGVASTMNIYFAVEKAPSDIKEMVNSKKRNSKIEYDTTISNCAFIYDAVEETTTESQIETTNTSSTTKTKTSEDDVKLYRVVKCGDPKNHPEDMIELPENLVSLISKAISAIQVVTPLVLIITGMLDFLKATTASNEDGIKKAQQTFIRRLIAGAAVFFIIAIVKIVIGILNTNFSSTALGCINSFINFKSYDDQRDESIENTASSCIELYKNGKDYNNCICGLAVTIYNTEGGKVPDSIKKYDELNKLVQSYEGINRLDECPK